jgi:hypothetical protein
VNYYTLLGVGPRATQKEIKAAYHRLARRHHPDINPSNAAAEELLKEINAAYETLSDPDKRVAYDRREFGGWVHHGWQSPPRPEWAGSPPPAGSTGPTPPRYSVEEMNQFVFNRLKRQLGRERIVWELYEWAELDWLKTVGFVRYAEIIYRCEAARRRRAFTRLAFYGTVGSIGMALNLLLGLAVAAAPVSVGGFVWVALFISSVVVGGGLLGFVRTLATVR